MKLFKRGSYGHPFKKVSLNKQGQITLSLVWKVLAIIGLVVAALILWNIRGTALNYLAKFYDCMRFRC